jgi:hypothetical protein
MRRSIFGSPPVASTRTLDGLVEPHGRRLLAFRRTRLAQRLIACNAADPYPLGDEPDPPKGGAPSEEVAQVNTHFPLVRIAFAAAAAVFIFLMVHAALEGISGTADVLAGLQ